MIWPFYSLWRKSCSGLPFEDEEMEAGRGEVPPAQNWLVLDPGFSDDGSLTSQPCSWPLCCLVPVLVCQSLLWTPGLPRKWSLTNHWWHSWIPGTFIQIAHWRSKEQVEVTFQSTGRERNRNVLPVVKLFSRFILLMIPHLMFATLTRVPVKMAESEFWYTREYP